jgi:hypothetical protein
MTGLLFAVAGALVLGVICWLFVNRKQREWALAQRGVPGSATVTDVRDDRTEMQTIVTYAFDHGGATYLRTGVLRRDRPVPAEGSRIAIVFVPDDPKISRLAFEEGHGG